MSDDWLLPIVCCLTMVALVDVMVLLAIALYGANAKIKDLEQRLAAALELIETTDFEIDEQEPDFLLDECLEDGFGMDGFGLDGYDGDGWLRGNRPDGSRVGED